MKGGVQKVRKEAISAEKYIRKSKIIIKKKKNDKIRIKKKHVSGAESRAPPYPPSTNNFSSRHFAAFIV